MPRGKRKHLTQAEQKEMLTRYIDGENILELVNRFGVKHKTLSNVRRRWNVPRRETWYYTGKKHWSYRTGKMYHPSGYIYVLLPDDHEFKEMAGKGARYVAEHRLVMAQSLGRPLTSEESVHHINGVKADNRLENLQLRRRHHGFGQKLVCASCGATNIVAKEI